MSLNSVQQVISATRKGINDILEMAQHEQKKTEKDRRLTDEGKQAATAAIVNQARQAVAELSSNIGPAAEKAVSEAQTAAIANLKQDRQSVIDKAQTLGPILHTLDEKQLINLYQKRAAQDPAEGELIAETLQLKFDLRPDSADKQSVIGKWNKTKEETAKNLPAGKERSANDVLIAAGSLSDYAAKVKAVTELQLQELQGKPLNQVDKVLKARLEHEARQFEQVYN